jgi:glycosyltransferase involved in cell wall biosynthesis
MKRARYVLDRCAAIDALSEEIGRELTQSGLPCERVSVSPSGFFDPGPYYPEWPKKPWIVFCGRFFTDKNPLLAIEAMPHVLRVQPEAHLFMFGAGPEQSKIMAAIQQQGLQAHTTVRWVNEPAATLRRSSVFLSLQGGENYPSQSLLEAMAAGNAVVATDVGQTRKLVTEENGVLVAADARQVGEAILKLLTDPDLARKGERSREIALQHTGSLYLPYVRALCERVARNHRAGS